MPEIRRRKLPPGLEEVYQRTRKTHTRAAAVREALQDEAPDEELEKLWLDLYKCNPTWSLYRWDPRGRLDPVEALAAARGIELNSEALLEALEAENPAVSSRIYFGLDAWLARQILDLRGVSRSAA